MGTVRIAVDANGGDNAPDIIVDACHMAIQEEPGIELTLYGDKAKLKKQFRAKSYDTKGIFFVDAKETIENTESPVLAIRRKKNSSIVMGLRSVKEGHNDAFISAGSTGAVLAGGTLIVGRIKGIERPALGTLLPTSKGMTLLMDVGANMDSKPAFSISSPRWEAYTTVPSSARSIRPSAF